MIWKPSISSSVVATSRIDSGVVVLDGTLLRIDRVGVTASHDHPYCSGRHKCHGVNEAVDSRRPCLVEIRCDPHARLRSPAPTGTPEPT